MKGMQTLGRYSGSQEGIFQYKRTSEGVLIDASVGRANLDPDKIVITHEEWLKILTAIANTHEGSFRLTGQAPFKQPPNQSLYELLQTTVPNPKNNWKWLDSWKSYVCSILEHEGTIDLYHGRLGPDHVAMIYLRKDT